MRTMFGTAITIAVGPIIPVRTALGKLQEHGIDWGLNDGTIGTWMGIKRSTHPMWKPYPVQAEFMLKDIPVIPWSGVPHRNIIMVLPKEWAELIKKLQEDKDNDK
jgi:hypothetical protein